MQEFCNGGSLRDALVSGYFKTQFMPQRWTPIMTVLSNMALGMDYMHAKRICHGDLNPANILFKVRARISLPRSFFPSFVVLFSFNSSVLLGDLVWCRLSQLARVVAALHGSRRCRASPWWNLQPALAVHIIAPCAQTLPELRVARLPAFASRELLARVPTECPLICSITASSAAVVHERHA
jgi:serine/threonine protein kinase